MDGEDDDFPAEVALLGALRQESPIEEIQRLVEDVSVNSDLHVRFLLRETDEGVEKIPDPILILLIERIALLVTSNDPGNAGSLLHRACCYGSSCNFIRRLNELNPNALNVGDVRDHLPLHCHLFLGEFASLEVVKLLVSHYPGAVRHQIPPLLDYQLVLHLALNRCDGIFLYLLEQYPSGAAFKLPTKEVALHRAYLHPALMPSMETVIRLIEVYPEALCTLHGFGMLHLRGL